MDWQRIRLAAIPHPWEPWQSSSLITMIREVTGFDRQAANALLESGGALVDGLSPSEARRVAQRFIDVGVSVEVEPSLAYEPVRCVDVREPTLEARLRDDPTDVAAHLVYADWLQAQGNPLGELIALQVELARAEGQARAALEARDRVFRQSHAKALLGQLHPFAAALVQRWSLGFIEAASVGFAEHDDATAPLRLLAELLRLPAAARMNALSLPYTSLRRRDIDRVLCRSEVVACLRTLELRECRGSNLSLAKLWAHMRGLETLIVNGTEPPLRELGGARLRHLLLRMRDYPSWEFRPRVPIEPLVVETLTVSLSGRRRNGGSFEQMFGGRPWVRADTFVVVASEPLPDDFGFVEWLVIAVQRLDARRLDLSRCGIRRRALERRALEGVEIVMPQSS